MRHRCSHKMVTYISFEGLETGILGMNIGGKRVLEIPVSMAVRKRRTDGSKEIREVYHLVIIRGLLKLTDSNPR